MRSANPSTASRRHHSAGVRARCVGTRCGVGLRAMRECWPAGMEPKSVSYFTGVQPGPDVAPRPNAQPHFPEEQARTARILSESFVRNLLAEDLLVKDGETGYDNLVIAGDWIDNGVQLACMEGAFTGDLQAGDAILQSKTPTPS